MIMYLQVSGRLSACYSYLSLASAGALKMGMHRKELAAPMSSIELESRRRTFWSLWTMDTYLTTQLGLPRTIHSDWVDQQLPLGFARDPDVSNVAAATGIDDGDALLFNRHTKLIMILSKVIDLLYLGTGLEERNDKCIQVPISKIEEIENELDQWFQTLPAEVSLDGPGTAADVRYVHLRSFPHLQADTPGHNCACE
jgi:Fungal specific transcription factor domain